MKSSVEGAGTGKSRSQASIAVCGGFFFANNTIFGLEGGAPTCPNWLGVGNAVQPCGAKTAARCQRHPRSMPNVCAPTIRTCVNKTTKRHLKTPRPKSRTRYGYNTNAHQIAAQIFDKPDYCDFLPDKLQNETIQKMRIRAVPPLWGTPVLTLIEGLRRLLTATSLAATSRRPCSHLPVQP